MATKNYLEFKLGADPEFCCVDPFTKELVFSNTFSNFTARFGADGGGANFELRPAPSYSPIGVVKNLYNIMLKKITTTPILSEFDWIAGSYHFDSDCPIGGHIHFGIPYGQMERIGMETILKALDNFLGLPAILLEDKEEARMRRDHGGYGDFGDYRDNDHGFEYRTPSSWLTSPYISASVLSLAKVVMDEIINNPKFIDNFGHDTNGISPVNHRELKKLFPSKWNEITKMRLYPKYKGYIDLIASLVEAKKTWHSKQGMKQSWGVSSMAPEYKKRQKVNMEKIWNGFVIAKV